MKFPFIAIPNHNVLSNTAWQQFRKIKYYGTVNFIALSRAYIMATNQQLDDDYDNYNM